MIELIKPRYAASWDFTPENFRPAYQWMIHYLTAYSGIEAVPIWCWHSCNGKLLSPPTVGTAFSLMGDWEYYSHQMRVIELEVPKPLSLLSSYYQWNNLLDAAMESKKTPSLRSKHQKMFREPLIKHGVDDIQAVLPFIERDWVLDVRTLPENAEEWDNLI